VEQYRCPVQAGSSQALLKNGRQLLTSNKSEAVKRPTKHRMDYVSEAMRKKDEVNQVSARACWAAFNCR
jgi:hypothetical protein